MVRRVAPSATHVAVAALVIGCIAAPAVRASAVVDNPFHPVSPAITRIALSSGGAGGQAVARGSAQSPAVAGDRRLTRTGVQPFGLAAVTWRGSLTSRINVTIRVHDQGEWSRWHSLDMREQIPDAASRDARIARVQQGTEPLLTSGYADGVDVRIRTAASTAVVSDVQLLLINGKPTAADALASSATPPVAALARPGAAVTGPAQPTIISRAGWGADETWRRGMPSYSDTIKIGFVHHTVTATDYSRAEAPAQVRAVYAYDTKGLGISDLGYNYMVDRFGTIYEGRAGGVDQPVIGAHTAGFNENSFAVAVLGDYQHNKLPKAAAEPIVRAISAVAGWKLALFHVDPMAPVNLVSNGLYGTSKYEAGEVAKMPYSLIGHGDIGKTQCPGAYLRPYLPQIRTRARDVQGAVLWQPRPSTVEWDYKRAPTTGVPAAGTGVEMSVRASVATDYVVKVLSPCSDSPIATQSGRLAADTAETVRWNGLTAEGNAALPGDYDVIVTAVGDLADVMPAAVTQVRIAPTDTSPRGPCARVYQFGTDDVVATTVAASTEKWPAATTAIIYNSSQAESTAGMIAATAAARAGAALLPVGKTSVPYRTIKQIKAAGITSAVVIARTGMVGPAAETQLRAAGITAVQRIIHATTPRLALAVAKTYWPTAASAVVVAADDPPQSVVQAASLAVRRGLPMLVVDSSSVVARKSSPAVTQSSAPTASKSQSPTRVGPTTKKPTTATTASATKKPTATKTSKKPTAKKPTSSKRTTARKPTSKKPTSRKPSTRKPTTSKPTSTKPTSKRPSTTATTKKPTATKTSATASSSSSATSSPAPWLLAPEYVALLATWGGPSIQAVTMNSSAATVFASAVSRSTVTRAAAADRLSIATLRALSAADRPRIAVVGAAGDGPRWYPAAVMWGAPVMVMNAKPSLQFLQWLAASPAVNEVRYFGPAGSISDRGYTSVVAALAAADTPTPTPTQTATPTPSPTSTTSPSPTSTTSPSPTSTTSPSDSTVPAAFTVRGRGFGHGVGMSQYGAQAQALDGRTATQIIEFYYTGSDVKPLRDDQVIAVNILHRVTRFNLQLRQVDDSPQIPVDDPGAVGDFVTSTRSKLSQAGARYRFDVGGTASKPLVVVTQIDSKGRQTEFIAAGGIDIHWGGTRNPERAGSTPAYADVAGPGEGMRDGYGRYRYGNLRVTAVRYDDNGTMRTSLEVANNVRIHDEYLRGIGEVPASWQPAALQAQVIASRGFALAAARSSVKYTCGCQLYDGTSSQVFAGWMREVGYSSSSNLARAAQLGIAAPGRVIAGTPAPSATSATPTATKSPTASSSASASSSTSPKPTASSSTAKPTGTATSATPTPTPTPTPTKTNTPTPSWSPTAELPLPSNIFGRKWAQAVIATSTSLTHGKAATVDGKAITTYFYSASGGRTENSEDIWGGKLSYARSIADPWSLDDVVPDYIRDWRVTVSQKEMSSFFGLTDVASVSIGDKTQGGAAITLIARSSGGRTSTRKGTDLRRTFDLRSRWLTSIKPRE